MSRVAVIDVGAHDLAAIVDAEGAGSQDSVRGVDDGELAVVQKISVEPWADLGRGWCRTHLGPRGHSDGQSERRENYCSSNGGPDTAPGACVVG